MTPSLSIVIPTHDRAGLLRRTLESLARQTVDQDRIEVTVVADGCRDDTALLVRAMSRERRWRVIEQWSAGAAAARNRGAEASNATRILFLDDDMEAAPGLAAAHLAAHEVDPLVVVLGYTPLAVLHEPDVWTMHDRLWWSNRFRRLSDPAHRFTFEDVATGNLSLPRATFEAIGRFDASCGRRAGEDYELGVRLVRAHVPFRFDPAAMSLHHYRPRRREAERRARSAGRGHVWLARKHPDVLAALPLARVPAGRLQREMWRRVWGSQWRGTPSAIGLRCVLAAARLGTARGLWQRAWGALWAHAYWRGVQDEVVTRAAWETLREAATPAVPVRTLTVDLAEGWPAVCERVLAECADALVVLYRGAVVACIEAVPGGEPLRPVHVREALTNVHARAVLAALDAADRSGRASA